ncbi:hypothetical protein JRQ81_012457 [Phrynocephalus forsythii]|uniref:U3 small nucleolar RNA-associated protein NOL7 C-terminal domain-containing protein n=1 Tax=Phrynocephalus forsythii TaxID=171643 RepID=A0A9Q1B5W8_9SAUR|nr:hypothetical protein JRQ81_012457 [Phrynocephalus forsythii]
MGRHAAPLPQVPSGFHLGRKAPGVSLKATAAILLLSTRKRMAARPTRSPTERRQDIPRCTAPRPGGLGHTLPGHTRSVGSGTTTTKMVARRSRAAAMEANEAEAEAPPAAAGPSDGEEEEEAAAGSDGGDEAPEEVTFESARVAAEEERRLAGERARREKAILKEKRRRREELFKEQKKRKLLPEKVLEELASTTQERNQQCDALENAQDVEDDSETEDEDTKEVSEEEATTTRFQENYVAVRLKDQDTINRQQQEARNFVQKLLYGQGSNRTTANQYFSIENKKRAVKKAAVQFVSNSWGKCSYCSFVLVQRAPWFTWQGAIKNIESALVQ